MCYSKDVRLPIQLQRAMAAEAEAAREARAKVSAVPFDLHCARTEFSPLTMLRKAFTTVYGFQSMLNVEFLL